MTCFSKHLMNVVRQDPVADPVQGLDQPEFGLYILCLFLLAVNNVQLSNNHLRAKYEVQVIIVPFPTWCDCSRSLSHRGFSHSQIICCWTLSPRPMSTGVITINLNSEFFSFSVLPCRPHRWRHTWHHTSPPPSHHHQLIFSKVGRGGENKLPTFLKCLTKTFLKSINGSTVFLGNSLFQNFPTCVIW